jgi:putative hydrolase of the HAD superfamily
MASSDTEQTAPVPARTAQAAPATPAAEPVAAAPAGTERAATIPVGVAAVLLDYGGTLDGDALHWFDHFVALYAQEGAAAAPAALKGAFYAADAALAAEPEVQTYGLERMVRSHVRLQLPGLGIDDPALGRRIADAFIADTRRAWERNRPLLDRLAGRFRLGVVSNSYGNMPALLAEARLGPFELVLDSALVGLHKPDPALYTLACARLRLPAAAILHVGDSWERDVMPARAVGMRTAWLARIDAPMPVTPAPVWRLSSLLDLEALLS